MRIDASGSARRSAAGRRFGGWSRFLATTTLATSVAVAVAGSGVQPLPHVAPAAASADAPAGTYDLEAAAQVRADQCRLDFVLRKGGSQMKAVARAGLHGTDAELHTAANDDYWDPTPLSAAFEKDRQAASVKLDELYQRNYVWSQSLNQEPPGVGYSSVAAFQDPPGMPGDPNPTLIGQTGFSNWIADQYWTSEDDFYEDLTPIAAKDSADAVTRLAQARYYPATPANYEDRSAFEAMTFMHGMYADDARIFLQNGGFPTSAPADDSLEFRVDVENLKARFASCASANPPDPHQVLTSELAVAGTEWQTELAGQREQRDAIFASEAQANKDLQTAAQALGESLGQSLIAGRLADWQAYWLKQTPASAGLSYPKPENFAKVKVDIANAQARATGRLYVAQRAALDAQTQADKVEAAKQAAYTIADAAGLPRGRGLLYGQQAAQVTKASAAAALAAAKATETAANATRASAADSKTLSALAMTQAHAAKADFRRKAAEEAAAQAKASAESAALQATKAAENADKAKAAQTKAATAEQKAKSAAADADAKRVTAEQQRDYAKSQRDLAASERNKAAAAERTAQSQRQVAADQLTAAQTAGATASEKKDDALAQEARAQRARDAAAEAERKRDYLTVKADAADALLAAVDGTADAIEARQAATQARTAADNATSAATQARAAADSATEAATNARAAATRAEGAAKRAQAAADGAKRDVAVTEAAVKTAHAAAAEAIDAAGAARWNAVTAKAEAETARQKAVEAKADAASARAEAVLAGIDSVRTAGFAYATAQAATAARDAAAQVIKPANDAIELGTPYKETDSSAGLAVLTGQAAKTAAEQQAAVANAKAAQAAKAAAEAKDLAAKAGADAKAAADAAAQAADWAAKATKSSQQAQASASAASASAKAAQKSETNTVEYNRQATEDAAAAQSAATTAGSYSDEADASATDAEKDAASARSAATEAEGDASTARGVADQAEKDATTAEAAAAHARDLAVETAQIAIRTQDALRDEWQERQRTADGGVGVEGVVMRPSDDTLVDIDPLSDCVGTHTGADIGCEIDLAYHVYGTMDFYLETCSRPGVSRADCGSGIKRDYLMSAPLDVRFKEMKVHVDGFQLTASVLKALALAAVKDIIDCSHGKLSGCLWLAGSIIVPKVLAAAAEAAFALRLAIVNGGRLTEAIWGLRGAGLTPSALASLERAAGEALASRCFVAGTKVATESGPKPIEKIRVGDRVWSTDPATGEKSLQRVLELFDRTVDRVVSVRTAGGGVEATESHRFWVQQRGWVEARDLRAGDALRTESGAADEVTGTSLVEGKTRVFNFEVDNAHTYYVYAGSTPVLVHNECGPELMLKDLVQPGDHIVLGINPMSDELAASIGGKTFNNRAFGAPVESSGGRPAWMVGVLEAVGNPEVKLSVSLDGVKDATSPAEALDKLVERGIPLMGADWGPAAAAGNGTAWEMASLRSAMRMEKRQWSSVDWYWKGAKVTDMPVPAWGQ
ncbi:polymorphic toxin type 27 domain-containing protein [Streptomyces sp. NPDC048241]|uniref:polymorphic toxin type 27 domain-containing protein n=1 Tax=Streptomyces sp. NPDC048241 TaxID=3365521 RepID=UPI00371C6F6C